MFYENAALIRKAISKKRVYKGVKEISSYHRIQASSGYREAAHHADKMLKERGIESRVLEFEAKPDVWYQQQKMFQEWECKEAYLDVLIDGEAVRFCDFNEEKCSVLQKSYPMDFRSEPIDVVLVESNDEEYLKTLDLKGKFAFIHERPEPYLYTVIKKYGAVGFITDFIMEVDEIRARAQAYDTFNYTSFWWKHREEEPKTGGFVLSPRLGDKLKALCLKAKSDHEKDKTKPAYPQVNAYINSRLFDGKLEVVEGYLKGESDEELLITAHLCHPNASANDNASGVSGAIEVMTVLKNLTESGKLPPLKRSIRVLLMAEFTGTHCYLSTREKDLDKIVASVNLDMIGGKQDGNYGPITITLAPYASHSIVNPLSALALDEARKQAAQHGLNSNSYTSLVNSTIAAHSGGSDHTIMCDPTIDAPAVMVGQWPDKYYHTSSDQLECIDPLVLAFSTSFAATYIYTLANLDKESTALINDKMEVMMLDDLNKVITSASVYGEDPCDTYLKLKSIKESYELMALDVIKYGMDKDDADKEKEYLDKLAKVVIDRFKDSHIGCDEIKGHDAKYDVKFKRNFIGPIRDFDDYIAKDRKYEAILKDFDSKHNLDRMVRHVVDSLITYFMDGKFTVWDASEAIFVQSDFRNPDYVLDFMKLLVDLDLAQEIK